MILLLKILGAIVLLAVTGVIVTGCLLLIIGFWDDITDIIKWNRKE